MSGYSATKAAQAGLRRVAPIRVRRPPAFTSASSIPSRPTTEFRAAMERDYGYSVSGLGPKQPVTDGRRGNRAVHRASAARGLSRTASRAALAVLNVARARLHRSARAAVRTAQERAGTRERQRHVTVSKQVTVTNEPTTAGPAPTPPIAGAMARRHRDAGGRALIVGGWVRDRLLGHPSKDVDLEVFGLSRRRAARGPPALRSRQHRRRELHRLQGRGHGRRAAAARVEDPAAGTRVSSCRAIPR